MTKAGGGDERGNDYWPRGRVTRTLPNQGRQGRERSRFRSARCWHTLVQSGPARGEGGGLWPAYDRSALWSGTSRVGKKAGCGLRPAGGLSSQERGRGGSSWGRRAIPPGGLGQGGSRYEAGFWAQPASALLSSGADRGRGSGGPLGADGQVLCLIRSRQGAGTRHSCPHDWKWAISRSRRRGLLSTQGKAGGPWGRFWVQAGRSPVHHGAGTGCRRGPARRLALLRFIRRAEQGRFGAENGRSLDRSGACLLRPTCEMG